MRILSMQVFNTYVPLRRNRRNKFSLFCSLSQITNTFIMFMGNIKHLEAIFSEQKWHQNISVGQAVLALFVKTSIVVLTCLITRFVVQPFEPIGRLEISTTFEFFGVS